MTYAVLKATWLSQMDIIETTFSSPEHQVLNELLWSVSVRPPLCSFNNLL